jgi:ferredoxin
MAYVIAEPCLDHMDQTCVEVCPVDCISADLSADRKFYIDPDSCIDCGSCESSCPNSAIFRADTLPAEWSAYAWIDATWYRDPEAARAEIERSAVAVPR